jgi:hypothetical protein
VFFSLFQNLKKMGLIKEPKNVDLIIKSEPWSADELKEFRKIMKDQKAKRKKLVPGKTKHKSKQRPHRPAANSA